MVRLFRAVTIVAILAASAAHGDAQPSVEAASLQAELEEAKQLNELVEKLYDEGKYQEAAAPAKRALAIREKALGATHLDVAASLNKLAEIYWTQHVYVEAESLFTRALAIREEALGPLNPAVAESLDDLGGIYQSQGAYAKAEPLELRALEIREKTLGPNHHDVAASLNNLGGLYGTQGMYGRAESLWLRALEIHEKTLGPDHRDVAGDLNNLGLIYKLQGAYAKAESLYMRALAIREKQLGRAHPLLTSTLNNLAVLYIDEGAYVKAEPLLVRALDICEKVQQASRLATSLTNLAELYRLQGEYSKVEPLLVRALEIREKVEGSTYHEVAVILNDLALFHHEQGAYAKAESLYIRALSIYERTLGPNHPYVAHGLNNLALLYQDQGAYSKSERNLTRAAEIREQQLRADLIRLPEPRKRALMTMLQRDADRVVSFHADVAAGSAAALDLALATVLRGKGRILDSLLDSESRIRRNLTPGLRELLDQLSRARSDLSQRLYASARQSGAADRVAADAVRVRINELETKLSLASAEFRTEVDSVTVAKVRAQIPNDAALVEFVKYRRFDPKQRRPSQLQEERYVAYLLTARGAPQWAALGEAVPIDAQVDAVLAAIRDNAPVETTRIALQRLDALVLAPVRSKLPEVSHLILAPDGQLNLVPFEALVDPQGLYALDNYLISYVTNGRDLLRIATPRSPRSPTVIVADPAYGPLPLPGHGTMSFIALPDARGESTDLQAYFPGAPLTGEDATKAKLAALIGPAILHIATHGFYARDVPSGRPAPGVLHDVARGMHVHIDTSYQSPSRSEDLADGLDRSGLALAGANQGGDGIVTAREIAGFDWWGTQLVVLSACDTGVGAASSGDGVYGLRRALVLAGAASQVVSLWAADDAATRVLMRDYYGELARGAGRAEGLRQAKLRLMRQPRYEHPYYWAAFIAAGDWRPLAKGILSPAKSTP